MIREGDNNVQCHPRLGETKGETVDTKQVWISDIHLCSAEQMLSEISETSRKLFHDANTAEKLETFLA